MVPALSLILMVFTGTLCIAGPIALAVWFHKKAHYHMVWLVMGILTFSVLQVSIRIPLLQFLSRAKWYLTMAQTPWQIALFLGSTAGLFEEGGRLIAMKWILKKNRSWKNGVAFGIGHGGIEALLLVGMAYLTNLIMAIAINTGLFDVVFGQEALLGAADTLAAGKAALIGTAPYLFAVAGFERLFTVAVQIAFSLIILTGIIRQRTMLYALVAFLLHTLLDFGVVLLQLYQVNLLLIEAGLMLTAAAACIYILKSKKQLEEAA